MAVEIIMAQVSCGDLERSTTWFTTIFERPPDRRPMNHLAEWHDGPAGLQLFEQAENAGHSVLSLVVSDLAAEHRRLTDAGLGPPSIERGDDISLCRLRDLDGNLVVLVDAAKRPS